MNLAVLTNPTGKKPGEVAEIGADIHNRLPRMYQRGQIVMITVKRVIPEFTTVILMKKKPGLKLRDRFQKAAV